MRDRAGAEIAHRMVRERMDTTVESDPRVETSLTEYIRDAPAPRTDFERRTLAVAKERLALSRALAHDDEAQRAEYERCKGDVLHFLTYWGWTHDPRLVFDDKTGVRRPTMLPFVPFEQQAACLAFLNEAERAQTDAVVEKSREVGLTWLVVAWMVHRWLFVPGWKGAVGSRVEDLVDILGDSDSILEKVRIFVRYLPPWLRPLGYSEQLHARYMRIRNPANDSTIKGQAGDNIGRGGRNAFYFIDEAAFIERSNVVDAALSFNCPCKVFGSTPHGMGNTFYQKRTSGKYAVFTIHWKHDPRKSKKWYDAKCEQYEHDPVLIAQELDLDYSASVEGIVIPAAWVRAAVGFDLDGYAAKSKPRAGMDVAAGGANKTVLTFRVGPRVDEVLRSREANTSKQARWADEHMRRRKAAEICYDAGGVGVGVGSAFEDMAVGDGKGEVRPTIGAQGWSSPLLPYTVVPIQSGQPAGDELWPDGKTSREKFANVRTCAWWKMRIRFEKTYEHTHGVARHPPEEMVSLPDEADLVRQLSTPTFQRLPSGKIQVESKETMRKRNVKSPDEADSFIYAFWEEPRHGWVEYTRERAMAEQAARERTL